MGLANYKNGYAVTGNSLSLQFSEGNNLNAPSGNGDGFISYLEYWPLQSQTIIANPKRLVCYPNPAQSSIRVELADGIMNGEISIVNTKGAKVYMQKIRASFLNINTKEWARGVYVVEYVDTGGEVLSSKITLV